MKYYRKDVIFTDISKIVSPAEKKLRAAMKKLKRMNIPVRWNKKYSASLGGKNRMCVGADIDCDICLCDLIIAAVGFSMAIYFMAALACPKKKNHGFLRK